MIRSSNGRLRRKAATVCGASSYSKRATKRIPAATISSTGGTLARCEPACEEVALGLRHPGGVAERHCLGVHGLLLDVGSGGLDLVARVEANACGRRLEPLLGRVLRMTGHAPRLDDRL